MAPRSKRLKSIRTPLPANRLAPSQRETNDGPNPFQLQRKAEVIGAGIVCDIQTHAVEIAGGKTAQAKAEFATSSALALLYHESRIDHPRYRAGCEYGRLHRLLWGPGVAKGSSLTKVMATTVEEALKQAAAAARTEMDDDERAAWLADQRVLYQRAEFRLDHLRVPNPSASRDAGKRSAHANRVRAQIRSAVRATCVDDLYPANDEWLFRLRLGLGEIASVWDMDRT